MRAQQNAPERGRVSTADIAAETTATSQLAQDANAPLRWSEVISTVAERDPAQAERITSRLERIATVERGLADAISAPLEEARARAAQEGRAVTPAEIDAALEGILAKLETLSSDAQQLGVPIDVSRVHDTIDARLANARDGPTANTPMFDCPDAVPASTR